MWWGPSSSLSSMRRWSKRFRNAAFKPRPYGTKGSSCWTTATSCPQRFEQRTGGAPLLEGLAALGRLRQPEILVGSALLPALVGGSSAQAFMAPFPQVAECMQELERHLQELQVAWALRGQRWEQTRSLQQLRQRLELAEAWLASWERLLLDPSCGVRGGRP